MSSVARKHGIVTGLLFRWRVQFGVAQKKRAKLAPVALDEGTPAARVAMLIEGIDWRAPERVWKPALAG
ncbi:MULTISPECIES: hypothetical protein [Xanthobacter]|uniref:hypothetical protein n=1 Tax=Xanthobacter TaxID=279 RepID=UPI001F35E7F6